MVKTMKLDHDRMMMSLSNTEIPGSVEDKSSTADAMDVAVEDVLPQKVSNVSREELRKYVQCKRVGNYLLGKTVGEGSFAKVKEALHILTGEKVAIKIIDKNRARKDRYVSKNMRREARLLQMIRHPHIVQLLEVVETTQCYYLVFEFADGGDLMDYICKRKKLDEEEVKKFIRQIISAVEYLHRLGIIHRDLKVENLLLDADHNIKIIDFGLSNTIFSPDPTSENHCSTQCGSPAYAAPELLVRKDYGPQVDVWSIGVNMYAMLTGRLPYTVEPFNISNLYNKMLRQQMNSVPEYLTEGCKDFIYQLLNPNPTERIDLLEATRNRWITNNHKDPLVLITCPNYLREEDLEDNILDHVESRLKLNSDDVIRDVIQNRATKNSCVYYLLLRRLKRYKKDYEDIRTLTPRSPKEHTNHVTPSTPEPSTPGPTSPDGTTLRQDPNTKPKTHIIENPFKTIKVALIRHKKSTKSVKSKSVTFSEANLAENERAQTPQLCPIKKVSLVKVAPAPRRPFRGVLSSGRNLTSSPIPGRRKPHFDGLCRKSPKVRRRNPGNDDSRSSIGSNSLKNSSFAKRSRDSVRRRSQNISIPELTLQQEINSNNNTTQYKSTAGAQNKTGDPTKIATPPVLDKSPETLPQPSTDEGPVTKQDALEQTEAMEIDRGCEEDQGTKGSPEDMKDTRETKSTEVKSVKEIDVGKVVNAKISSIANRRGVERLEPIIPSTATPGSSNQGQLTPQSASPRSSSTKSPNPRLPSPTSTSLRPMSQTPTSPQPTGPQPTSPQPKTPQPNSPRASPGPATKQNTSMNNIIHKDPPRKAPEPLVSPRQATNKSSSPTRIPVPTSSLPKSSPYRFGPRTLPSPRTPPNNKIPKLNDKYTKCYSVAGANRPREGLDTSGGKENTKLGSQEEKEGKQENIINTDKGPEQASPKENRWRTERNLAKRPSFTTKDWRKNENIKNITRNGFLPNTNRFTKQFVKTGEQFKKAPVETEGENSKLGRTTTGKTPTGKTDEIKRPSVVNYASRPNTTVRRTGTGGEIRKQSLGNRKDSFGALTEDEARRSTISNYVSKETINKAEITGDETSITGSNSQSKPVLYQGNVPGRTTPNEPARKVPAETNKPNQVGKAKVSSGEPSREDETSKDKASNSNTKPGTGRERPSWAKQNTRDTMRNFGALKDNDARKPSNEVNSTTKANEPTGTNETGRRERRPSTQNTKDTSRAIGDLEDEAGKSSNEATNTTKAKEPTSKTETANHIIKPSWANRTIKPKELVRKTEPGNETTKPSWANRSVKPNELVGKTQPSKETSKPSWANRTIKTPSRVSNETVISSVGNQQQENDGKDNDSAKPSEDISKRQNEGNGQARRPGWSNKEVKPNAGETKTLTGVEPKANNNNERTQKDSRRPSWANKEVKPNAGETKTLTGVERRANSNNERTEKDSRRPSWANKEVKPKAGETKTLTGVEPKANSDERTQKDSRRPSWANKEVKTGGNVRRTQVLTGVKGGRPSEDNNGVNENVNKGQTETRPSWANKAIKPGENCKPLTGVGSRKPSVGDAKLIENNSKTQNGERRPSWANKVVKPNENTTKTETSDKTRPPSWATKADKTKENIKDTQTLRGTGPRNSSVVGGASSTTQPNENVGKTQSETRRPSWGNKVVKPGEHVNGSQTLTGVGRRRPSEDNESDGKQQTETSRPSWANQTLKPKENIKNNQAGTINATSNKPSWANRTAKLKESFKKTEEMRPGNEIAKPKESGGECVTEESNQTSNERAKSKVPIRKSLTRGEIDRPSWANQRTRQRNVKRTQTWTAENRRNIALYRTNEKFRVNGEHEPQTLNNCL